MKKLALVTALTLATMSSLVSTSVQAATTPSGFNVAVNLTAQCLVNTAASALDFGAYTGFGSASIAAPTTNVTFKCTKGVTISSVVLDATTGVAQGLVYTLSVGAASLAAGAAATATVGAGADVFTYVVTGAMASGQPGSGSGAGTSARTLTITY